MNSENINSTNHISFYETVKTGYQKLQIKDKLILLPRVFNRIGNVAIYDLLKETGYFEMYDQLSEEIIFESLAQHPEYVNDWLTYSEDKRTNSGWYFKQEGPNSYKVGYFGGKESENIPYKYIDRIKLCAAFIKRESEDIRGSSGP
jgi:hypothetical protein